MVLPGRGHDGLSAWSAVVPAAMTSKSALEPPRPQTAGAARVGRRVSACSLCLRRGFASFQEQLS